MIVDYKPTTMMSHYVYRLLTTLMTNTELIRQDLYRIRWRRPNGPVGCPAGPQATPTEQFADKPIRG